MANHISHLDPLYDSVAVRKSGRVPRFMAKASLWKVPVLGKALAGSDQIPVERTGAGAGQASLELATETLRRGKVVLIYPEGTVTRDPGHWPMKPRPGIGALALSGDFPVIPVAHWGSNQVYDSYVEGRKFHPLPRKDVHTVFGEPIDLTELRSRPVDARSIRDASLLIMTVVRDMVAEIRERDAAGRVLRPEEGRAAGEAGRRRRRSRRTTASEPRRNAAAGAQPRRSPWASPRTVEQLTPAVAPIERVAVLGAGSWGTTYAKVLADAGRSVTLWARRESVAAAVRARPSQPRLPARASGCPRIVGATSDFDEALDDVDAVVLGVPSQALRENLRVFRDSLPPTVPIVSLAKGVEIGTGLRMSEVIERVGQVDPDRIVVLTGPEPGRRDRPRAGRPRRCWPAPTTSGPCAVQVASATPYFRPYTITDVIGAEIAGTGKNIVALACGIADGLGLGSEHLGLADHPRAERGVPARRRTRRVARPPSPAWPGSATWWPPAGHRCPATARSAAGWPRASGWRRRWRRPAVRWPRASSAAGRCATWRCGTRSTCRSPSRSTRSATGTCRRRR